MTTSWATSSTKKAHFAAEGNRERGQHLPGCVRRWSASSEAALPDGRSPWHGCRRRFQHLQGRPRLLRRRLQTGSDWAEAAATAAAAAAWAGVGVCTRCDMARTRAGKSSKKLKLVIIKKAAAGRQKVCGADMTERTRLNQTGHDKKRKRVTCVQTCVHVACTASSQYQTSSTRCSERPGLSQRTAGRRYGGARRSGTSKRPSARPLRVRTQQQRET